MRIHLLVQSVARVEHLVNVVDFLGMEADLVVNDMAEFHESVRERENGRQHPRCREREESERGTATGQTMT